MLWLHGGGSGSCLLRSIRSLPPIVAECKEQSRPKGAALEGVEVFRRPLGAGFRGRTWRPAPSWRDQVSPSARCHSSSRRTHTMRAHDARSPDVHGGCCAILRHPSEERPTSCCASHHVSRTAAIQTYVLRN